MIRNLTVSLMGLLACGALASAQLVSTVYVPDNNTTTGAADTVLFNAANGRCMYNLIRGEVGPDSVNKRVVDLALVPAATGTFSATRLQIRMGRGFLFTLDKCYTNNVPCPTVVYDGPFTWNAVKDTWTSLQLQNPYVTDGKSNVVIDIRWQGGSGFVPVRTETPPATIGSRVYDITSQDPWNAICGSNPESRVPRTRLNIDDANTFLVTDHNHVGLALNHTLLNCKPFSLYTIAASFGQNTLLPLGPGPLRMDFDTLMFLSLFVPTSMFQGYTGLTDNNGKSVSPIWEVPNIPGLAGLCIVHGAVIQDLSSRQIIAVTNTMASEIKGAGVP